MTQTEFTPSDLVFRLHGGQKNGTIIPVKTQNCLLGNNLSTDSQGQQCAIVRGPHGTAIRSHGSDVTLNGVPVESEWLRQGDRIEICDVTLEVIQIGEFYEQEIPTAETVQKKQQQTNDTNQIESPTAATGLTSFDELAKKIHGEFSSKTETPGLEPAANIEPALNEPLVEQPLATEIGSALESVFPTPIPGENESLASTLETQEPQTESLSDSGQSHEEYLAAALGGDAVADTGDEVRNDVCNASCDSACESAFANPCESSAMEQATALQQPENQPEMASILQTGSRTGEPDQTPEPESLATDLNEASSEQEPIDWMDRLKRERDALTRSEPEPAVKDTTAVEESTAIKNTTHAEEDIETIEAEPTSTEQSQNESVAEILARMQSAGKIDTVDFSDESTGLIEAPPVSHQPQPVATPEPSNPTGVDDDDAVQQWMQKLTGGGTINPVTGGTQSQNPTADTEPEQVSKPVEAC